MSKCHILCNIFTNYPYFALHAVTKRKSGVASSITQISLGRKLNQKCKTLICCLFIIFMIKRKNALLIIVMIRRNHRNDLTFSSHGNVCDEK